MKCAHTEKQARIIIYFYSRNTYEQYCGNFSANDDVTVALIVGKAVHTRIIKGYPCHQLCGNENAKNCIVLLQVLLDTR